MQRVLPNGTEGLSLSSSASLDAGSSRNASEEYSLIQEAYGPLALMMPGAAMAAALSWHPMYAYSRVHGIIAASMHGRLCNSRPAKYGNCRMVNYGHMEEVLVSAEQASYAQEVHCFVYLKAINRSLEGTMCSMEHHPPDARQHPAAC